MIYHVYANQSNVGDWLSARGIQSLLAPLELKKLFCDTPFVPDTINTLNEAGPEDFIIIGGGGLFMDYFVPFWESFLPIAARVPFIIWGAGCCDLKRIPSRPPRELLTEIVRKSQLCVVRDALTRSFFSDCELPSPIVCPAVNAVRVTPAGEKRLLHVDHFDSVGPENYDRMVAIAQAFAERTGLSYRQTNNLIPAGHNGALQKTLDLYASADLVLSSRLHGCIIALAMGRKVLVVSGDCKVESFMQAAGLGDWVCDLADIESLPVRLEKLVEQRWPVEFIELARLENRAVATEVSALLSTCRAAPVFG
jgi:polysaccharide pyruvyl transferase WcaK-like protein